MQFVPNPLGVQLGAPNVPNVPCVGAAPIANVNAALSTSAADSVITGADTFTFTVNDGGLTSLAATVGVSIGNTAPVAAGQSQTTVEDTALVITLSGTDRRRSEYGGS